MVKPKVGSFEHKIPAGGTLSLSVTVGNAQVGGGSLVLNGVQLIKAAEIKNFILGDCSTLDNQSYTLFMNVIDVNPMSDRTSVLVEFSLGVSGRSYLFEEGADTNGVVQYKIEFKLMY